MQETLQHFVKEFVSLPNEILLANLAFTLTRLVIVNNIRNSTVSNEINKPVSFALGNLFLVYWLLYGLSYRCHWLKMIVRQLHALFYPICTMIIVLTSANIKS